MYILRDKYRLEKTIGQGGMGKVYLATDLSTNKLVAIKESIITGKSSENKIRRLQREFYFMTRIKNPYIVRGLDFFDLENRYFIVMEYIEGITLKKLIHNYPHSIPFEKQLKIAQQICKAIIALNDHDIIHRDIKPSNIVLQGKNATPKILDLGIAKAINGELESITKLSVIGTPQYMAPEQINKSFKISKSTDVFALGALFYQFFSWSQQSPFYAKDTIAIMKKVINFHPPLLTFDSPHKFFVAEIIDMALQKEREYRISSVKTMLDMLLKYIPVTPKISSPTNNAVDTIILKSIHSKNNIPTSQNNKQSPIQTPMLRTSRYKKNIEKKKQNIAKKKQNEIILGFVISLLVSIIILYFLRLR
ncbi:serine/threonine-protein kinase [Candidatus Uabimicrobium sp. HlEnr_7]|uniref:serine/threonine-protein kinase n=1 Tax=Candidatus Uabimicrobium helgolandensis TaxID=3095367 RepID=UPI0035565524